MKKLITIIIMSMSFSLFASETISIKVKGMVCSFCSDGLEKTFKSIKGINSVSADLDKFEVLLSTEDNAISDGKIKELIRESGFLVHSISRINDEKVDK